MRKYIVVPILVLLGGAGAFLMRLAQVRTGFEASTGLPIANGPWRYVLPAFLLVLAALLALAVLRVPERSQQQPASFSAAFAATDAAMLTLPVTGAFLLLLSGLLDIAAGLGLRQGAGALSPRGSLLMGVLTLCTGGRCSWRPPPAAGPAVIRRSPPVPVGWTAACCWCRRSAWWSASYWSTASTLSIQPSRLTMWSCWPCLS